MLSQSCRTTGVKLQNLEGTHKKRSSVKAIASLVVVLLAGLSGPAHAHFQTLYTPDLTVSGAMELPLKAIFWHPFIGGPNVDMPLPLGAFAINRGQRIDLLETFEEVSFEGPENSALAYDLTLPVTRAGDYVTVVVGDLYFDESSDLYVQQFTKTIVNSGGLPSDWNQPVGLPTEIVPMTKPYNVMAGSTFTGRLLSDGRPLPDYEIEIVYLSTEPDMGTNAAAAPTAQAPQGGMLVATTDENGVFTVGLPRPGFWGFGALGAGPEYRHEDGTYMSQDAILWVQAVEL